MSEIKVIENSDVSQDNKKSRKTVIPTQYMRVPYIYARRRSDIFYIILNFSREYNDAVVATTVNTRLKIILNKIDFKDKNTLYSVIKRKIIAEINSKMEFASVNPTIYPDVYNLYNNIIRANYIITVMSYPLDLYDEYNQIKPLWEVRNIDNYNNYNVYIYNNCTEIKNLEKHSLVCNTNNNTIVAPDIKLSNFNINGFNIKGKLFRDAKSRDFINYEFVLIHNIIYNYDIWYYMSQSQGLWRICVESNNGILEKGNDYVSETLLEMNMQSYINKVYDELPLLDRTLTQCMWITLYKKSDIYNVNKREITSNLVSIAKEFNRLDHIHRETPRMIKIINKVSNAMSKMFNIASSPHLLYTIKRKKIPEIPNHHMDVKYIDLSYNDIKHPNDRLYYTSIYNIHHKSKIKKIKSSMVPFLVIPVNYTINKYGLYNTYYSLFPYTNKQFDYVKQCAGIQCTYTYNYIGHYWKNIFPFNKIEINEESVQIDKASDQSDEDSEQIDEDSEQRDEDSEQSDEDSEQIDEESNQKDKKIVEGIITGGYNIYKFNKSLYLQLYI